jgi:hypothetical protein
MQQDLSIAAAADLLKALGGNLLTLTTAKIKHVQVKQEITAIMAGQQSSQ